MSAFHTLKKWVKHSPQPIARLLRGSYRAMRAFELPRIPMLYRPIDLLHRGLKDVWGWFWRVFYWTPLFKSRLMANAPRLYLYGGIPVTTGPLHMRFGRDCRLSAQTTISGRWAGTVIPQLTVGDNVGIGWMTTIAVGTRVILGDNVRIAGRAYLAGYPGHPLNAQDRAAGKPDTEDQIGEIILERDVWLGTGVSVMAGVTIGQGAIVAAGSVVTRDLPANVLAGGVPARVIRHLDIAPPVYEAAE